MFSFSLRPMPMRNMALIFNSVPRLLSFPSTVADNKVHLLSDNCLSGCLLIFYQTARPWEADRDRARALQVACHKIPYSILKLASLTTASRPHSVCVLIILHTSVWASEVSLLVFAAAAENCLHGTPRPSSPLWLTLAAARVSAWAILRIRNTFCGFRTAKLLKQAGKSNCYVAY